MVSTLADDVDIMVHNQPIVLPLRGQDIWSHTPQPQPPVAATQPQTPEPRPQPHTLETRLLIGRVHWGLVTARQSHPAVPTLQEPEAAGYNSDVDEDQ